MKTFGKYLRFLLYIVIVVLLGYLGYHAYLQLLTYQLNIPNTLIHTLTVLLLVFLIILIIRFFFLLWFSFLETMETMNRKMDFGTPKVSIIVPAFNEEMVIENSIKALMRIDYPDYEIIVVNDGSKDETLKKAMQLEGDFGKAKVKVLNKRNSGKAKALNFGLEHAEGELVVSVDADSKLDTQTLKNLVSHFRDPKVGAVAGNVKVLNRVNFWTRLEALEYIEGLNLPKRAQSFMNIVNIIPGPLGMFKKRVLKEAGGYTGDTFAEDCDLTLKILSKNWKIKYEPSAISETEAPETIVDIFKQRYRWTRGIIQALFKHKKKILLPFRNFSTSFTLWMLAFDSIIWPAMNIVAHLFLVFIAINYGFTQILILWWFLLTILELAIAMHCINLDDEDFSLVPYSVFYRLFYILAVDCCKLFSLVEEILGLGMSWSRVDRKGRL